MYYNSSDMTCVLMSDLIKDWNKPLKILKSMYLEIFALYTSSTNDKTADKSIMI